MDVRAVVIRRLLTGTLLGIAAWGCRAAAASSVKPAVIAAQTPQAFTLAVPLQSEITRNVAVQ